MDLLYNIQENDLEGFVSNISTRGGEELEALSSFSTGGASLLHWASLASVTEFMNILFAKNIAVVDAKDSSGATSLHWASGEGKVDSVSFLLAHNANVNTKDFVGETPMHWASLNGHHQVISMLLSAGASINLQSDQGSTALHSATVNCHLSTVSLLIRKGADILIKDKSGKSARDIAVERKNPKLIDYFNDEKRETYEKIESLETQVSQLTAELTNTKQEKETTSLKLHNTYKELIAVQQEHKEVVSKLDYLQQKSTTLEEENVTLKEKALQDEKLAKETEAECKYLKQRVAQLESDINKVLLSKPDFSPHLADMRFKDALVTLNSSLATLQQYLNASNLTVNSVKSQIEDLTK